MKRITFSYPKPGVQIFVIIDFYSTADLIFTGFEDSSACFQNLEENKTGITIFLNKIGIYLKINHLLVIFLPPGFFIPYLSISFNSFQ